MGLAWLVTFKTLVLNNSIIISTLKQGFCSTYFLEAPPFQCIIHSSGSGKHPEIPDSIIPGTSSLNHLQMFGNKSPHLQFLTCNCQNYNECN